MEIMPVKTKTDYRAALKEIESLISAKPNTPQGQRLDVLATLVEAYEAKQCAQAGIQRLFNLRAGTRPGRRPTFLLVQESRQRSTPRCAGLTSFGFPRCESLAGPPAKLAALRQRGRTSPGSPSSLGSAEGALVVPWTLPSRMGMLLGINSTPTPLIHDSFDPWQFSVATDVRTLRNGPMARLVKQSRAPSAAVRRRCTTRHCRYVS